MYPEPEAVEVMLPMLSVFWCALALTGRVVSFVSPAITRFPFESTAKPPAVSVPGR